MHEHPSVLVLAIGPVQPFIAAARRTRDLWFGSHLLSQLALAVTQAVQANAPGAQFIFPAVAAGGNESLTSGVSNKIVCLLPAGTSPGDVAAAARLAALQRLEQAGQDCLAALGKRGCVIEASRFVTQLGQVLEFFSGWATQPDLGEQAYLAAYREAQRMLDARKRLRNFAPNAAAGRGLPLSSLDALAETVIPDQGADHLRRVFGIDPREALDALGMIKRVLGREKAFPAVTRVALQPWVAQWSDAQCTALSRWLEPLENADLAQRNACSKGDPLARLRWDCEVLLTSRRQALQLQSPRGGAASAALDGLTTFLCSDAGKTLGLPIDESVYVAMLLADGDRMGALLSDARNSLQHHQALSGQLAGFAGQAHGLVSKLGGACIYSGGDDVMALLPVATALIAARRLADAFATCVQAAQGAGPATLSVGVAIAHVMTPLGRLRQLAEQAQKLAKKGHPPDERQGLRNALGVVIKPRNGAAVLACGRWSEPNADTAAPGLDGRLLLWQRAFAEGALSSSAPYDLTQLIEQLPESALPAQLLRLVQRRTEDVQACSDAGLVSALKAALIRATAAPRQPGAGDPVRALANEWYLGRWLAGQPQPPKPRVADDTALPCPTTERQAP